MNTTLRNLVGAVVGGAALTLGGFAVASAGSDDIPFPVLCLNENNQFVPCDMVQVNPALPTIPPNFVNPECVEDLLTGVITCPGGGDGDADADGGDGDGGDGDADGGDGDGGDGDADGGDGDGGDGDGGDGDGGTPDDTDPDPDECGLDQVCERTPTFTG